jgi:NMD protein affecting ribosome stability and mRNA decay
MRLATFDRGGNPTMARERSKTHSGARTPRPPRRIHEESPGKDPEIGDCPGCGASYRAGRWTWQKAPVGSVERVCPACERIADDYPAGVVDLAGGFLKAHREELINLARHVEERECREHPLKRIMTIVDEDAGIRIPVTDGKLAEAIGRALKSAYEGELEHPPTTSEKGNLVRIRWTRD